jgi:hypothetical protein
VPQTAEVMPTAAFAMKPSRFFEDAQVSRDGRRRDLKGLPQPADGPCASCSTICRRVGFDSAESTKSSPLSCITSQKGKPFMT